MSLTFCVNVLHSARESPVAWEGEQVEGVDNNQQSQPESHSSPGHNQGQRRWEAEEESKDEPPPHEDEGSTSGVGASTRQVTAKWGLLRVNVMFSTSLK